MKVLFIYLKAFSFTGGIEKFNRSFLKALHELSVDGLLNAEASSAYDSKSNQKYFPDQRFSGFGGNRLWFSISTIVKACRFNIIVIGHINLAPIGFVIKKIKPSIKLVLVAHGIEVWDGQKGFKRWLLREADLILAVSNFTRQKIIENNQAVRADRITIFPNTLDPYFFQPVEFKKPAYLLDRYKLSPDHCIVLTVTRLSSSERYKGYDNVINTLPSLARVNSKIRYVLCGKADVSEQKRLQSLLEKDNCQELVTLPGFIPDEELTDHYLLTDVFVMQSKKEGFGIVFIEALACGRKVIAGSKDGSVDALLQGELGMLIDPDSKEELKESILASIDKEVDPLHLQTRVVEAFGFKSYKDRLKKYLSF